MENKNREKLFANYHKTHVAFVDSDDQEKLDWFQKYTYSYYLPHIKGVDKNRSKILEIGCNKGFLLAALSGYGFKKLYGIDISPDDIEIAKKIVPDAIVTYEDALSYLDKNDGPFDIIILKAVLEHMSKDDIMILLEKIKSALNNNGKIIVDVPNMDWLFSTHERYMDFTHEVGFTKESLRQVMNIFYSDVQIIPVDHIAPFFFITIKKKIARLILNKLFSWADPEGAHNPIWARSIIGIGNNNK